MRSRVAGNIGGALGLAVVLLVVAVEDHRMRLETGRGIGSRLNDARAKQILDGVITPRFKKQE